MNTLIKLFSVLVVLNIFMYMGVNFSISAEGGNSLNEDYNFHFEGDLIDSFFTGQNNLDTITQDTKENWTSYGVPIEGNFTSLPSQEAGEISGQGGIIYLDALKMVYSFIKTLGNIAIAPLTLFFNFRMPVFVGLMIGIPYFIIIFLSIIGFIRGVGG